MIDEFVKRFKAKGEGLSTTTLSRIMGSTQIISLHGLEEVIDIYGCAWYETISQFGGMALESIYDKFYSDVPEKSLIDEESLKSLVTHLQNDVARFRGDSGAWDHSKVQAEDPMRVFLQLVHGSKFEFSTWLRSKAAIQTQFQPLGLITDKFFDMNFFGRHASNVGVVLNWDASFMDADDSKYRLMVIDRWPDIIERLMKRFGKDTGKLPRFCYGFNDFYLLRPVAVSILRNKKVPDEIFRWFCLWHFRRVWDKSPSDKLFAKAICKVWEEFREVIYGMGYKRNHLFNCLMRISHELGPIPITREQLGDIYPSLIRAALKRNDKTAADFVQTL